MKVKSYAAVVENARVTNKLILMTNVGMSLHVNICATHTASQSRFQPSN